MSDTMAAALTGVLILAAAVWVGGLVAVALVARAAATTLEPAGRIALFRGVGRTYGVVSIVALAVAYGAGAALIHDRDWDGALTATATVATALAATVALGVLQARRMTRLRGYALAHPEDRNLTARVRRGAARAGALRGVIALLTLVLLSLGVLVGS